MSQVYSSTANGGMLPVVGVPLTLISYATLGSSKPVGRKPPGTVAVIAMKRRASLFAGQP